MSFFDKNLTTSLDLAGSIQDFEINEKQNYSLIIATRALRRVKNRCGLGCGVFESKVLDLGYDIWNHFKRTAPDNYPSLSDFVDFPQLIAFLTGIGPDNDNSEVVCLGRDRGCQQQISRYFTLLCHGNFPYYPQHFCSQCANRFRNRANVPLKVISVDLSRWRCDPRSNETIPAYVAKFLKFEYQQHLLNCGVSLYNGTAHALQIDRSEIELCLSSYFDSYVTALTRRGSERKHIVFFISIVRLLSSYVVSTQIAVFMPFLFLIMLIRQSSPSTACTPRKSDILQNADSVGNLAKFQTLNGMLTEGLGDLHDKRLPMDEKLQTLIKSRLYTVFLAKSLRFQKSVINLFSLFENKAYIQATLSLFLHFIAIPFSAGLKTSFN